MPSTVTSAFSDPDDFDTALRKEGVLSMLVTARGQFRARLTQISLDEICISAVDEHLPRIAFIAAPIDTVLIFFSIGNAPTPVFGGTGVKTGELIALYPGARFHFRTDDASHWGLVRLQADRLASHGSALTGTAFSLSRMARRWRPASGVNRNLRSLHAAAIRLAVKSPQVLISTDAAHGLEQQLLHAVVDCLSQAPVSCEDPPERETQDTMLHFEQMLRCTKNNKASIAEICVRLRVSDRSLRRLCAQHLGMSPRSYDRLSRMYVARRNLRRVDNALMTVSAVARHTGFRDPGRFAISYRAIFGETPSATLQRARASEDALPRRPVSRIGA